MGRELRRKQAKRDGKSLKNEVVTDENQIKKLIIITIVLVVIVSLIYLLSALFVTKELDWFDNKEEQTDKLVDNTILASKTFDQSEEEYYVYFYDYDEEDEKIANTISSLKNVKIYRVDTGSMLNKNYVSDESNKTATSLPDLKVKASTIIKVSGDTIVEYYENDEIIDNLG